MRSLDLIHCCLHDTEVQNEETPFVRERKQKITLSRFFSDQIYIFKSMMLFAFLDLNQNCLLLLIVLVTSFYLRSFRFDVDLSIVQIHGSIVKSHPFYSNSG